MGDYHGNLHGCLRWPTIAVDTHIYRVSNRTKFAMGKDVVAIDETLVAFSPIKNPPKH